MIRMYIYIHTPFSYVNEKRENYFNQRKIMLVLRAL